MNHYVDQNSMEMERLDGNSGSGRTCSVLRILYLIGVNVVSLTTIDIRCWEGAPGFKKDVFLNGGYKGEDVDSIPLRHTSKWALCILH